MDFRTSRLTGDSAMPHPMYLAMSAKAAIKSKTECNIHMGAVYPRTI
jgi:hypothetical protein